MIDFDRNAVIRLLNDAIEYLSAVNGMADQIAKERVELAAEKLGIIEKK